MRNNAIISVSAILLLCILAGACFGEMQAYEPFAYVPGLLAGQAGGNGFVGAWSESGSYTSAEAVTGGLSGPFLPPDGYRRGHAQGSYVAVSGDGGTGAVIRSLTHAIDFDPASETVHYFSVLFRRLDNSNGGGTEIVRLFDLRDDNDPGVPLLVVGTTSTEQGWALLGGYGQDATTAGPVYDIMLDEQEPKNYLMVARLTVRTGSPDELDVNFYECALEDVPATAPTSYELSYAAAVSGVSSSLLVSVQKFAGTLQIDEMRIGTEYADVVPEFPLSEVTIETHADAHAAEGLPEMNYGTGVSLRAAGRNSAGMSPVGRKRVFMGFDCSGIEPGSTVREVEFGAYQTDGSTAAQGLDMFRLDSAWSETGVSWSNMPIDHPSILLNTGQLPQGVFAAESDALRFVVQDWVGHVESNYGLSLRLGASENDSNGDTLAARENPSPGSLNEPYPARLNIGYLAPGSEESLWLSQIEYSHPDTDIYIGSPSIVRAPNGSILASHDHFGGGTDQTTSVYRSWDEGLSWEKIASIRPLYFANLFVHAGSVYLLGVDGPGDSVVIHRSDDNGQSWTTPVDAYSGLLFQGGSGKTPPNYGTAPMPVVIREGRIYRTMEDRNHSYSWPGNQTAIISADLNDNLLHASSWTISNKIILEPAWAPSEWQATSPGWLEGCAVLTPTNEIYNIIRVNSTPAVDKAAVLKFDTDTMTLSFDPAEGFIDFPGGTHKFVIRRDPVTGAYLSLVNNNTYPLEAKQRNTLSLTWSQDLIHWRIVEVLIEDDQDIPWTESIAMTGFQYADWQFDGDDIIYVLRTSYDGADNYHDANRFTFGRIDDYVARIPIPGDFNGDRAVNLVDFSLLAVSWQSMEGQGNWDHSFNFVEPHDVIDMNDLKIFVENWGLTGL